VAHAGGHLARPQEALTRVAERFGIEVRAAARNLVWKALSSSLEKVCRLVLVIVAAPVLGQTVFGRFQFATTVTTMLALGTDLGLGLWTTRELARSRAAAQSIVGTTLKTRALVTLPYAGVTALVALAVRGDARDAILLFGVSALASAFVDHFAAILRGHERFGDEARLNAARALSTFGFGLSALWLGRSLLMLAAGMTIASVASCAYGLAIVGPARGVFDARLARTAVRESLPIWLAGLLSMVYFKGDTILLRWLVGESELGAYGAAYKIFEGSQLLPAVLMAAAFPPLARARGDRERRRQWEGMMAGLLLGLGLGVGLLFHAGQARIITTLFGGGFARAVPSLAILALAVPLMYLNCGLTHFLIARDLGGRIFVFAAAMVLLNVGVNLIAIPRWGGPGAAWATVLTEVALTGCCLFALSAQAAATADRTAA
jgi:PST family polysaccharide transporter